MSATDDSIEGPGGATHENEVGSVSIVHQVFGAFADALAAQPERVTVADRLRKALIIDGARTEATLRAALFEGDDA